MRRQKLWIVLCVLFCLIFGVSFYLNSVLNQSSKLFTDTGYKTGVKNNTMAYDENRDIFFVGTYDNKLIAFSGETKEKLWEMDGKGVFRKLVVHSEDNMLYAGSDDNHVYFVNIETGEVVSDINVQRRIYDIDVTEDGSEVVISAGVSTAKHNILVYSSDGEQLHNNKYTYQVKCVCYTADDSNLITANNRGEIIRMEADGTEVKKVRMDYEVLMMVPYGMQGEYLAMGSDGSYMVVDDDLNIIRTGTPNMVSGSVALSIGGDQDGEHILIGTKQGTVYIIDNSGRIIYTADMGTSVSGFLPMGDEVYITGYGDFVMSLDIADLDLMASLSSYSSIIYFLTVFSPIVVILSLIMAIPRTNRLAKRFGKMIYRYRTAYILLIPTFGLLIFFNYVPIVMAFTRAFTNWSKFNYATADIEFVGFDNFKMMFTEGYFLTGLENLLKIVVTGFLKVLTVPLLIAWLVYSVKSDRTKYILRFFFVLPIVVPSVVSALLWMQIYDPNIGALNQLLGKLGLESWQRVWLGNEKTAIWAIIFMGFPFVNALAFLLYYGGFTSIDAELYEAARMDGAKRFDIFKKIQFPLILPQLRLILTLTFIGAVQDFNGVYLLTQGGPGTSTYVPGLELYFNATTFGRYGYACALGVVMFIFIMVATLIGRRASAAKN